MGLSQIISGSVDESCWGDVWKITEERPMVGLMVLGLCLFYRVLVAVQAFELTEEHG